MRLVKAATAIVLAWLAASAVPMAQTGTLAAAGTKLDLLLQTPLDSSTAKAGDRFEATALESREPGFLNYPQGGAVIAVRGFVSSVKPAGKASGRGQLTLSFDELRITGTPDQVYRLRASVVSVLDPKLPAESRRLATGGVVGGRASFGMAALPDVMVNAAGTIVAIDGSDVKLPVGVVLRVRLDQPIGVPAGR